MTQMQDDLAALDTALAVKGVKITREAGCIERCHNVPHQGSYSNAAHTYGVLQLARWLYPAFFGELAPIILDHDVPERYTGDIPANVLRSSEEVKKACHIIERSVAQKFGLVPEQAYAAGAPELYAKFKACDRIELYLWCCEQLEQGNQGVRGVMFELERVWAKEPPPAPAPAFIRHVQQNGWARLPESLEDIA